MRQVVSYEGVMATLEIAFLHDQLEERKRRLEAAMALSTQKAGLAGLGQKVAFSFLSNHMFINFYFLHFHFKPNSNKF